MDAVALLFVGCSRCALAAKTAAKTAAEARPFIGRAQLSEIRR